MGDDQEGSENGVCDAAACGGLPPPAMHAHRHRPTLQSWLPMPTAPASQGPACDQWRQVEGTPCQLSAVKGLASSWGQGGAAATWPADPAWIEHYDDRFPKQGLSAALSQPTAAQ